MLEQMRRQGASIFIYLIFGLLIVIFVINFAPSRNRGDVGGGCSTSSNTVRKFGAGCQTPSRRRSTAGKSNAVRNSR